MADALMVHPARPDRPVGVDFAHAVAVGDAGVGEELLVGLGFAVEALEFSLVLSEGRCETLTIPFCAISAKRRFLT